MDTLAAGSSAAGVGNGNVEALRLPGTLGGAALWRACRAYARQVAEAGVDMARPSATASAARSAAITATAPANRILKRPLALSY